MATTKKPATKKTPTKAAATRKAPVKKVAAKPTAAKKAPAKKPVAVKTTPIKRAAPARKSAAKAKDPVVHSFRVAENTPPFTSFKITRQTVYWLIFVSVIIFAQLWILKTQYDVLYLLDQQLIDAAVL